MALRFGPKPAGYPRGGGRSPRQTSAAAPPAIAANLSERPTDIHLRVSARPENVAVVRRALAGLAASAGADEETIGDIRTAVTEACMNAVVHAYPDETTGPLEVTAALDDDALLTVCVLDYGSGIQPRPLGTGGSQRGMGIGLPLIGALADEFEIGGGPGRGTQARIRFDLRHRANRREAPPRALADAPPLDAAETALAVTSERDGQSAIGPVLAILAARESFSVDRIADLQLLGDMLADFASASADSEPLRISIFERPGTLELSIGPLDDGAAEKLIDRGEMPGIGNAIRRLVDRVDVQAEGVEFLRLRVTG